MPRRDQRPYNVRYYAANREREYRRVRSRQDATIEFLRALREVPCVDCGIRLPGHAMDFDHRNQATKEFNLMTGRAGLKSRAELFAEVAKCDVVCPNCHRLRTRRQHRARLATLTPSISGRIPYQRERWRYNADLLDQLRSVPCADCGGRYAQCSRDFDHREPSTKIRAVTRLIAGSTERLLAEAAKCDIVCANCHRIRTFERRRRRAA
jgi:hypothetical protein